MLQSNLTKQIETEISDYLTKEVNVSEDCRFSQYKLVRRIGLFENHIYPTGKFDKQGNYKYWYDKITSCINAEVKNVDIDTKNFRAKSDRPVDELGTHIINLKIKDWMRDNGQAEEINSAEEEGAGWGNVLWKKVRGGYERCDLRNTYIINQTAEHITETPVIERHQFSQSDLRAKSRVWKNVKEVIEGCKSDSYSSTIEAQASDTTVPYYDIYERNGEVCLKDLKIEKGEDVENNDEDKYVLAKVVVAGTKGTAGGAKIEYVLFSDKIPKMPYKEYHRGKYKGRWWREGLYELLFDVQVRLNQIGNQIAQGLEWASKTVFKSADRLIIQNILTDLKSGDIIKTRSLEQVNVRMEGFDQLANEWNRLVNLANDIANSTEVIRGITPPSGTPLGTTQLLDVNAGKLFDFIREKLSIPFSEIFKEWLIPKMVDDLTMDDVVNLTGNSEILNRVRTMIVDGWYLDNLLAIGPHTKEIADVLKSKKMEELRARPQLLISGLKKVFEGFKENVYVDIVGEQSTITEDTQSLVGIINLEADPVRRSYILDEVLKSKGFDVASWPRSQPSQPSQPVQPQPAPLNQLTAKVV